MFSLGNVTSWVKAHPWETGGAVFLVGALVIFSTRGGSSSSASGPDANLSAYLAAETAQTQYGDALSAVQDQDAASTAQAGIAANENIAVNNTWAASDLATTESNNTTSTQNSLIAALSGVANQLGTILTNTTSKGSSSSYGSSGNTGFLGIFGSTSSSQGVSNSSSGTSSQTFVANSEQAAAEHELEQIANQQFNIGS